MIEPSELGALRDCLVEPGANAARVEAVTWA